MQTERQHYFIASILFVAGALLIYGSSLRNGFVHFDDDLLVLENPLIREFSSQTIRGAFTSYDPELYIPLTILSYQIEYQIGGLDPQIYHFTNLLLHTLNAFLVFCIAYILLRKEFLVALFVGFLFLAHPLHTEAVAWIAARKDVLSMFFTLGCLLTYLSYEERGRRITYVLSLLLFLLALLSKPLPLTLPPVLLLISIMHRRTIDRKMIVDILPFVSLSIIFGVVALIGKPHAEPFHLLSIIPVFPQSVAFLLLKIAFPVGLYVLYPLENPPSFASASFLLSSIFAVGFMAIAVKAWRKHAVISFGIALFLITVLPTFFNLAKGKDIYLTSDRYAYLPSLGIFLIIGYVGMMFLRRYSGTALRRGIGAGVGTVVVLLGLMAHRQSLLWKDGEILFNHQLQYSPNSLIALNNRAHIFVKKGKFDEAFADYKRALERDPDDVRVVNNLAMAYVKAGKTDEAFDAFQRAIDLNPGRAETHYSLGIFFRQLGREQDARAAFRIAYELDPAFMEQRAMVAVEAGASQ